MKHLKVHHNSPIGTTIKTMNQRDLIEFMTGVLVDNHLKKEAIAHLLLLLSDNERKELFNV